MLCSSKINNRPDKLLQSCLIKLAFALVLLTIVIILLFLYPQHHLYLILCTVILISYCLLNTIKTLDAGETAISYGGFANEIIRNDFKIRRIENPDGEPIIQNDPAKELLKEESALKFIEHYLAEGPANKSALYRLQTAYKNLSTEKVTLSMIFHPTNDKIFNDMEWFEISVRPMYLKRPQIFDGAFSIKRIRKETYIYWTINNITAQKNMEHIFKEECSSLHDFLDYMPIGLYTVDKDYRIEYANRCFADFLGLEASALTNRNLSDFLATNSALPEHKDFWQGNTYFVSADNEIKESYILQTGFREAEKIKMRGVVLSQLPTAGDLNNRVIAATDQISWLFNHAPVGILFLNTQGQITDGNETAFKLFQRLPNEVLNHKLTDFVSATEKNSLQNAMEDVAAHRQNALNFEIHLNSARKDSVASLYISGMNHLHAAADAPTAGFVIYLIDATRQKSLELQFAQAQKMQAVGQLAGGVAHDFNNLLTAMIGFTDLLLQRHGVGDPSFADLIQIKQNANRAAGLVRQLLAFSRKQPLQPKLIDITDNFAELSHMLKRILGENITLKFRHGKDLGYIRVDPVQFSQVIINLAVNAKDAMNGNGTLVISTRTEALTEPYQFGDDLIKAGEFVVINVTDSGCGIPPENMSRIFDPFFSTKENIVGSGTGLGLAMVYGIVRQTEGFIKVESEVGRGTTFAIYLPRFENNIEAEPTADNKEIITGRDGNQILRVQEKIAAPLNINQKIIVGLNVSNAIDRTHTAPSKPARILFVEDEDSVRTFAIRALQKKGYDIVGCSSGENAMEHINNGEEFELLLTDMVMPGMSGADLTKAIRRLRPEIKVILASGYSEDIVAQELDNFENFDFITKPYSLGDLTAKVFDVLNRA